MPCHIPAGSLVANGRSWVDEGIVAALRSRYSIPDAVKIRIPSARQRPVDAPPGWLCIYECFFAEFGMRFPIFTLLLEDAFDCGDALAKHVGITFDQELFERVTDLRAGAK